MQEIADWLRGLGFEQYTRCFAENDIDSSILEGGVCTMCAPKDQRKSRDNQRERRCTRF